MDSIVVILLILIIVKFCIIGPLLFYIFRDEIKTWRKAPETPTEPVCVYCQSRWTQVVDQGTPRWEGEDLVIATTYECQHCHTPFWRVERLPVGSVRH